MNSGEDLIHRLSEPGGAPLAVPPLLIVVAHPDDEVLGAGSRLSRLPASARLVHVTDGAPRNMLDARAKGFATREAYARARRLELEAALALAGIAPEQTIDLGFIDQEASFDLHGLTQRISELLIDLRPAAVLTHPYEGGHPDHDATAFALHTTVHLLARDGHNVPLLLEMTSYHNRAGRMHPEDFLPAMDCPDCTVVLSPSEIRLKQRMIDCFMTQRETLSYFQPFQRERFRLAPAYDFTQPPHPGRIYYDLFDWGMTGDHWRDLARQAIEIFRLGAPTR